MPPLVEFKVALQIPPASLLIRKLAWISSDEKLFILISLFKTWDGDPAAPYITIGVPLNPEAGAEWNNGGGSGERRDPPPPHLPRALQILF